MTSSFSLTQPSGRKNIFAIITKLNNFWPQKTGKTVIKYLKKRKMTGDDLRREMWVHDEAATPKAKKGKKKAKGYDVS